MLILLSTRALGGRDNFEYQWMNNSSDISQEIGSHQVLKNNSSHQVPRGNVNEESVEIEQT